MPCYNGGNHSEDYVRQVEERLSERNNMPCSDGGYGRDYENRLEFEQVARSLIFVIANKADELRKEPKSKEALICSACRALEDFGFDFDKNPELSIWWDRHKKADAAREKKEAAKRLRAERAANIAKRPFDSLTPTEKKILKDEGYFN